MILTMYIGIIRILTQHSVYKQRTSIEFYEKLWKNKVCVGVYKGA